MDAKVVDQVLRLREANRVERVHTLPTAGRNGYTCGQHVADMLGLVLTLHPRPSANLLKAVVLHDFHERFIGDIPGAIREFSPEIAACLDEQKPKIDARLGVAATTELLDADERRWLKAVDRLEFFLWVSDQLAMGNRHVEGRLVAVRDQLSRTELPAECADFLVQYHWKRTEDRLP